MLLRDSAVLAMLPPVPEEWLLLGGLVALGVLARLQSGRPKAFSKRPIEGHRKLDFNLEGLRPHR